MSENINFIPATELPEAEGDEVSVLCVENGELKQKAASGLGGGSNDVVIVCNGFLEGVASSGDEDYSMFSYNPADIDGVIDAITSGTPVSVVVIEGEKDDSYAECAVYRAVKCYAYVEDGTRELSITVAISTRCNIAIGIINGEITSVRQDIIT